MMAKVTDIRIEKLKLVGQRGYELKVDFDNDRHHAVTILPPYSAEQVERALALLIRNLGADPHLKPREGDRLK